MRAFGVSRVYIFRYDVIFSNALAEMRKIRINQKVSLLLAIFSFIFIQSEWVYANEQQFFLRVGSFSNASNAHNLEKTLKLAHKLPVILKEKKPYTLVLIGPYDSKEQALSVKALNELTKAGRVYISKAQTNKNESQAKAKGYSPSFPPSVDQQLSSSEQTKPQSPPQSQIEKPKKIKKATRLWNLRQANIRSVIQAVSRETNKNFLIDQRVQGKISIVSNKAINSDELYQVFLSMLQVAGYAAIPSGDVIKIVPNIDARSIGGDPIKNAGATGDEMVVQVVPIRHVSAEQLVPVIRPLMPQWSNVSAYSPSNMLILSGRADNVQRLSDIIYKVDTSDSNGIDAISVKYALAMDIVSTIKALSDNQKGRIYQHQATIATDDRSNTILVSGPKAERLRIRLLVNQLDKRNAYSGGNTEVIYLKYLKAQDILPILSGVAKANFSGSVGTVIGTITNPPLDTSTPTTGGLSNSSDSTSTNSSASNSNATSNNSTLATNTQSSSSEGDNKPKVQIIADPNTNALILSAPQTLMRTFKTLIAKLDTRPAQVLVEALITEIDENDLNRLGIDWGTMTTDSSGSRSFNAGFAIISSTTRLSDFQGRLTALVTNQKANILSTPSVVVLDNRQAKILVGKEVSIQDSSYPGNSGGGGQTNPYNTFTRQNVALHLYVRPQISQGNSIQLQIDHGNDTLPNDDATAATSGRPVINKSSIQTSVLVNSGDVLVLGGLVQNTRSLTGQRIPILGDIPGIGKIFENNSKRKEKKVLMVFIRPIILDSNRSGLQVTGTKYHALRNEQLNFANTGAYDKNYKDVVFNTLQPPAKLPLPFAATKQAKHS